MRDDESHTDFDPQQTDDIVSRYESAMSTGQPAYFDSDEFEAIIDSYQSQGEEEKAVEALRLGLRLHPDSTELKLKQVGVMLSNGEISRALEILDRLPHTDDDYEANLLRLEAYCLVNRLKAAEIVADQIMAENTDDIDNIALDIAHVFADTENFEQARKYLETGRKYNPGNIDLLFELALSQEHTGRLAEAEQTYNRLIDINPYTPEAWFDLGQLHLDQKQYDKASEAFNYCASIQPDDLMAWMQIGHAEIMMGHADEALKAYQTSLRLLGYDMNGQPLSKEAGEAPPDTLSRLYTLIADCYEQKEQYEQAIRAYDIAIGLSPTSYGIYMCKAICLRELERYAEAITLLTQLTESDPHFEPYEAQALLAHTYYLDGQDEKALEICQELLRRKPADIINKETVARLLIDLRQNGQAVEFITQFIKDSNNGRWQLYTFLAIAEFRLGHKADATAHLTRAINIFKEAVDTFIDICPEGIEIMPDVIDRLG